MGTQAHTQERPYEDDRGRPKRGLKRNQPCGHLDLGTSSFQNWENIHGCRLSTPNLQYLYGSTSNLETVTGGDALWGRKGVQRLAYMVHHMAGTLARPSKRGSGLSPHPGPPVRTHHHNHLLGRWTQRLVHSHANYFLFQMAAPLGTSNFSPVCGG